MSQSKQAIDQGSILLVGNYRPSLPVARSLSTAGYRVVLARDGFSAAERSRFVDETWQPSPWRSGSYDFVGELQRFLERRRDIAAVFPVNQARILELLASRDRISVPLITVEPETVATCLDKVRTTRIAAEVEVPVARFAAGSSVQDLYDLADDLGYPCVVKRNDGIEHGLKALVLGNANQARTFATSYPGWFDNFMVQQFAWGPRYNRYFIAHRGRILRRLDIKTLRTNQIDNTGLGVSGVSTAPLAALDEPSSRLIEALGYSGIGCLQFLVDDVRGTIAFLEINPRIGGNYAFTQDCGLDQASALVDIVQGRGLEHWAAPFDYPVGKRYAWVMGDLEGLVQSLETRQVSGRQAVSWWLKAVAGGLRADHHLLWRWDDPKPALYLARRSVPKLTRRAGRQVARILVHRSRKLAGRLTLQAR